MCLVRRKVRVQAFADPPGISHQVGQRRPSVRSGLGCDDRAEDGQQRTGRQMFHANRPWFLWSDEVQATVDGSQAWEEERAGYKIVKQTEPILTIAGIASAEVPDNVKLAEKEICRYVYLRTGKLQSCPVKLKMDPSLARSA